jgi:hypothetical protein
VEHEVDFIVVGGVCAVIHGAPITTFDLDLVHSRSPENLECLLSALNNLDACYRGREDQYITPKISHLSSPGHHLLTTNHGPLDLFGKIGSGLSYKDLIQHTIEIEVSDLRVRILELETLIEVKKETANDKDRAMIPILERTLEEKRKPKA